MPTRPLLPRLALGLLVPCLGAAPASAPEPSTALRAELRAIRDAETAKLHALGESPSPDAMPPPLAGPIRFVPLPEVVPGGRAPARPEIRAAHTETTAALFQLAEAAHQIGRYALADE